MGGVVSGITDAIGLTDTEDAGDQARAAASTSAQGQIEAAEIAAESQREALEYLKQREQMPQFYREGALQQIGGLFGLGTPLRGYSEDEQALVSELEGLEAKDINQISQSERAAHTAKIADLKKQIEGIDATREQERIDAGAITGQQALMDRATSSPLYQSIMGGREAGEEAILRQQAATGGLRSGTSQEALYDYNVQLQNKAMLDAYNQQLTGLTGLANLPSMARDIASQQSAIGQTLGSGQLGAAQALAQGRVASSQADFAAQNQLFEDIVGGVGVAAGLFSDIRLKSGIEYIGESKGHKLYRWTWNKLAKPLGLTGKGFGVMADQVEQYMPDAVGEKEGYKVVDYSMLGVAHG